jgi:hypothetical protein
MAITISERYLKKYPQHRILVLTEGQDILRTQFHEDIEEEAPEFTYALNDVDSNAQVVVTLPQTLKDRKKIPAFDLVIVDEAHNWYHAKEGLVQHILKKTRAKRQLLLTGTPSPFNRAREKYEIIYFTTMDAFKEGAIDDFTIELASTTYDIRETDYTRDDNVRETFEFERRDTIITLDRLLEPVHRRLVSLVKNGKVYGVTFRMTSKLPQWPAILSRLKKTMFACRTQAQARDVANYFESKGVKCALSISDDNDGSVVIREFKRTADIAVLIVVRRGILGFSYRELVNVVDMTGTRNIDRIFQLMMRVARIHPLGTAKLFFKLVPHDQSNWYWHVMNFCLQLADIELFSTYDGKNLMKLPYRAPKSRLPKEEGSDEDESVSEPKQRKKRVAPPLDFVGNPALQFLDDVLHADHADCNIIGTTTLGKMRECIFNIRTNVDRDVRLQQSREFVAQHHHKPNLLSRDPEEQKLGNWMYSVSKVNGRGYDAVIANEFEQVPTYIEYRTIILKREYVEFCEQHGFQPSRKSTNVEEASLGERGSNAAKRDPVFRNKITPWPSKKEFVRKQQEHAALQLCQQRGYVVTNRAPLEKDRKLGAIISNKQCKNNTQYSLEFVRKLKALKLPTAQEFQLLNSRRELEDWIGDHGRYPSSYSSDPTELSMHHRWIWMRRIGDRIGLRRLAALLKKQASPSHLISKDQLHLAT